MLSTSLAPKREASRISSHASHKGRGPSPLLALLLSVAIAFTGAPLCGCADKSDISLTATMSEPHGSATAGVFGATFTGDSTLVLQVGEQSSGTSTVTLESFSLNSASLESLVSPLNAKPRGAQLPIVVSPGPATKVVFDLGPTELSEAQRTRICGESVLYVASISDSLSGGQVSQVQGPAFTVSCLP